MKNHWIGCIFRYDILINLRNSLGLYNLWVIRYLFLFRLRSQFVCDCILKCYVTFLIKSRRFGSLFHFSKNWIRSLNFGVSPINLFRIDSRVSQHEDIVAKLDNATSLQPQWARNALFFMVRGKIDFWIPQVEFTPRKCLGIKSPGKQVSKKSVNVIAGSLNSNETLLSSEPAFFKGFSKTFERKVYGKNCCINKIVSGTSFPRKTSQIIASEVSVEFRKKNCFKD